MPERAPPPPPVPLSVPQADGLPWVRLVTGLVALAMLAIPVGRRVAESDTRPIPDRVIVAEALPPAQPLPRPVLRPCDCDPAPAARQAPSAEKPGSAAVDMPQRSGAHAPLPAHHARRIALAGHRARAHRHFARTRHVLTRAQVEREYLAARDQVAALTREDSGSAWLMRVMARQRAARARPLLR